MKAITFFGGAYTGVERFAEETSSALGCRLIRDDELIQKAAEQKEIEASDIEKSIYCAPPFHDRFSPKGARCIAAVKTVLAEEIQESPAIFSGFLGELIPRTLANHVLVTAGMEYRVQRCFREEGKTGEGSVNAIRQNDRSFLQWARYLETMTDWRPRRCHALVASDYMKPSALIEEIAQSIDARKKNMVSVKSFLDDFAFEAKISERMALKRHPVAISVFEGKVNLTIVKPVLMLSRYKKRLLHLLSDLKEAGDVDIRVGPGFNRADIVSSRRFHLSREASLRLAEKRYAAIHERISEHKRPMVNKREEIRLSS